MPADSLLIGIQAEALQAAYSAFIAVFLGVVGSLFLAYTLSK
jgi:hypothetical protein